MACFFMQIWYFDKDLNIFIFEVDFGNICKFSRKKTELL